MLPTLRGLPGRRLTRCLVAAALVLGGVQVIRPSDADAADAPIGWLHTAGSTILSAHDKPYTIKATSWFGMETDTCAPHGLWQISLDSGLAQIRSFGFNTIRLPYSSQCLHASSTTSIDARLNPTLVGKTPLQVMDAFVARAGAHGLSVILDRHRPDSAAQSELWYTATYTEQAWLADWTMLAKRYATNSTVIGADLHNEPHGAACWGCTDPKLDWAAAAQRAGDAVLGANPHLLVIVEGVEKQGNGESTWWGGGLSDVAAHPVTLKVPGRLVYSPHDYPASIFPQSWFSDPAYPDNLPAQWDKTWGYLQQSGVAPVLMGEFGSKLETTSDRQWLDSLVRYLRRNHMSFAYWSFNPNSGDTGGLVKADWVTPETEKLAALAPLLHGFSPVNVQTSRRPRVPIQPR
ncbi:MAG: glycoside hydrolase family 5 protein [Propionibacteriaceae bacterium]